MSRTAEYHIIDEPEPSRLAHLSVNPLWPLLAGMLGGLWLGLPWFVLNGFAFGSAARKRELGYALGGLLAVSAGAVATLLIIGVWVQQGEVDGLVLNFCVLGLQLLKLTTYYALHRSQLASFGLHQYYGGTVRNGALVVVAAAILRGRIIELLPNVLLVLVLS